MKEKTQMKESNKKPTKSKFLEDIKKEMVSYLGLSRVYDQIYTCLDSDPKQVILITGETGVGKELVAKAIYDHGDPGKKEKKPFVIMDCGTTEKELLESKLFGHKKGAFTGAHKDRDGLFEEADGGILFLDEIGNLSLETQKKLLRVLEDRKVVKIGDSQKNAKEVDVKIIASTNKNLLSEIKDGRFMLDLSYRLRGIPIHIKPLRERSEDIPVLIRFFIEEKNKETEKAISSLEFELFFFCICYDWPGNVRELEDFITLCHINCESGKAMSIRHGQDIFSHHEWPKGIDPEYPKLLPPLPIAEVMSILYHIEKHDRDELRGLLPIKTKKSRDGRKERNVYPEIKLVDIPGQRKQSFEMILSGEVPVLPLGDDPELFDLNFKAFLRRVGDGEHLTKAEERYLKWMGSPDYKEWKRIADEDSKYEKFVFGLKQLYEKNEKALKSEYLQLKSVLQSHDKRKDLFSLPLEQAKIEFEKEWIRRALERNKQNKTKTAAEIGITSQALHKKLKKLNL